MLDYAKLKDWTFPEIEHRYTADDAMFYALAVGLGADPVDERQLAFVNDTAPGTPLTLPTMAVILGFPGSWMLDPRTGIDFSMIVHGEELIVLHRPLPAAGTVVSRHRVTRVVDKGAGKGATVTYDKELFDRASGDKLATVTHTTFCRGDGGFSARDGLTDASPPPAPKVPERAPDLVYELHTLPQQALLYRLCADRNPLHSEPAVARKAGFDRPILHGLGTYGVAGHALLATCCSYDPARLKRLFARFSAPVFPGETIRLEMYRDGGEIAFRARAKERDKVVLDYGRAQIAD
ncbi:MAG TPA: MaoC/PaaZ C-terminal domain-containing protein [Burkholderiales bacterium]|nr:MaoC/PaaZ C-terminal domain-containing protein [Burkholderiales bacterium]